MREFNDKVQLSASDLVNHINCHLFRSNLQPCRRTPRHGVSVQQQPLQRRNLTSAVPRNSRGFTADIRSRMQDTSTDAAR